MSSRQVLVLTACIVTMTFNGRPSASTQAAADALAATVVLRIYGASLLPDMALPRAENTLLRLFRPVRVEMKLLDCLTAPECSVPGTSLDVTVRVHHSRTAETTVCAVTPGAAASGRAAFITIYAGCLQDTSRRLRMLARTRLGPASLLRATEDEILAHLLAHELGHVFAPEHAHGRGLLHSSFGLGEWTQAMEGRLAFTASQAAGIRSGVRARGADDRTADLRTR